MQIVQKVNIILDFLLFPTPGGAVTGPIWTQRFFASTRGRIVQLLRRASLTVDALAQALDLTDNAVRAQLTGLERDGLVRPHGLRRGAGKPSVVYELTPEVEPALSRAYQPLLGALLEQLAGTLPERQLVALLRAAGQRLARALPAPGGDMTARAAAASVVLNELGGLTVAERRRAGWVIRSEGCPLAALVQQHPAVCKAVEAMVAEVVGAPVRERCDRSAQRPRCCFELGGSPRRRAG